MLISISALYAGEIVVKLFFQGKKNKQDAFLYVCHIITRSSVCINTIPENEP